MRRVKTGRDKPNYSSTNASPKSKTPKMCYSCNQPGHFKRNCPNLTRSAESLSPSPRPRAPPFTSDKKRVQFPEQPITMTSRFVPSVRAGEGWGTGTPEQIASAFLDDILILGTTAETHHDNLHQVFERFRQHGLKFKPK